MTRNEAVDVLAVAFGAPKNAELRRLYRRAIKEKRSICCGQQAILFSDGKGGG